MLFSGKDSSYMDKTNKKDALNYYSELPPVINFKTSSNHRLMESFRFWDEDDYGEYEIFSILSEPAREPAAFRRENVITVVILLRVSEQMSK